ncbi:5447_t:CDS:2 [Dentiscutata erythropus]|uniref:5447_t:CDS:1 n=1 Tax=Dentiscutata erythropus TaxID=1348616 RepID=A0A9N8Z643_9GLOM|nr:5447_t:CDS:2 [Dentiscutata erythropus]
MQDPRAESYMEGHDLKNLLNELEGGLQRHQPSDPYEYIVGCVKSVQQKVFEGYATQVYDSSSVASIQRNGSTTPGHPTNRKRQRSEEEDSFMEIRTPPYFMDQHVPHQRLSDEDSFQWRQCLPPSPPNHLSSRFIRSYSSTFPRRGRRNSVSAESIRPSDDPNDRTIHPKSEEVRKRINVATTLNLLFKNLDRETKEQIDAMFERIVHKDETIITQGEEGDNFYVIEHGMFEIFVDDNLVLVVADGGSFGELALMYNNPRAATVKAKTDGILWAVSRDDFRRTITNAMNRQRKTYESFIKSVSFLSSLNKSEINKLAEALEPFNYECGDTIITQGEPGEYFYIVEQGYVSVCKVEENGIEQQLPNLGPGDYFGVELALLNDQPRKATVVARGPVRVAALKRDAFVRLLGSVMDIFRRNAQGYNMNPESSNYTTHYDNNTTQYDNNTTHYDNNTQYDKSYSSFPEHSEENNIQGHGSGDESMAMDEDYISPTSTNSTHTTAKKCGYSGAGGVDVL